MMKSIPVWKQELSDGVHAARLASLYCCSPAETASEAARYTAVLDGLEKTFGSHAEAGLYSAPGRTEIGGAKLNIIQQLAAAVWASVHGVHLRIFETGILQIASNLSLLYQISQHDV